MERPSEMALLEQLRNEGLRLRVAGDQILVEPRGALTESLRATIRANKIELLRDLAHEAICAQERRYTKVEGELQAHPERLRAFDVMDPPLAAAPGEPLSVVLAIRYGDQMLSGEVLVPRERWDLGAFIECLDTPPGRMA
jgi:hypothetical protein